VVLSISGTKVFVSEGFELALARKLRDRIESAQPEGPMRIAGLPLHELSLPMVRVMASMGTIRADRFKRYTSAGEGKGSRMDGVH